MIRIIFVISLLYMFTPLMHGQKHHKGDVTLLWGYNRSVYLPSTIHFIGEDYDFKIENVRAKDRPSEFDPEVYFGLVSFTIPQYNYRLGYFFKENLSLSLGVDHMKYVMRPNQTKNISGEIDNPNSIYQGSLDGSALPITEDFLMFEHTDGLNYVSLEIDKHWSLWSSNNLKHNLSAYSGVGLGVLIPRSDVRMFDVAGINQFHLAGSGISGHIGFQSSFFKHIMITGTMKLGYIYLNDILTTKKQEQAKQSIGFLEGFWQVGYRFSLSGEYKKAKNPVE